MTNADRVKLLFGPYQTPRFRLGQIVMDEVRDRDVVIIGISDGRIPWPIGQPKGSRARSLIVFDALADAVRRESNQAVCHWWGITPQTVTKWRKALGAGRVTDGTSRRHRDHLNEPWGAGWRATWPATQSAVPTSPRPNAANRGRRMCRIVGETDRKLTIKAGENRDVGDLQVKLRDK